MSIVTDTWRQLVRRRLWPVALLLVGALAAVPFLLAKDPEPVSAPSLPGGAAAKAPAADGEPIVALATAEEARRRRVLGARKDPFEPDPVKAAAPAATPDAAGSGDSPSPEAGPTGGSAPAGSGGGTPTPDTAPPAAPPVADAPAPEKKPNYPLYTLTVRFGESESEDLPRSKVQRLEAMPSADEPVLVYLGVEDGGKVAVFMVDARVEAQGDGVCKPSPATCETIHLREGETEFLDVKDERGEVTGQYQLDLIDIKRRSTASAAKARAAESKAGRRVVRARQAAVGPLRYSFDARKGTVRKLGKKAFKVAVARVARAALASAGAFDVTR